MAHEPWPAPTTPSRPALPRVEDLPIAEHGYERDSVERAFDAFYRHLAQVDATLRVLEAVDAFNRSATELRTDLRTLRAAGWVPGSLHTYSPRTGRTTERPALPDAFPRVALEAAFIIIVAVTLGIARWSAPTILLVMGATLAIVWMIEWVASRERAAVAPAARTATVEEEIEEAEEVAEPEPEPVGWAALEGAGGDASDEMTMMGAESRAAVPEPEEPAVEPDAAPEPAAVAAVEPEPLPPTPPPEVAPAPASEVVLPEPDLPQPDLEAAEEPDAPRRRWFRRHRAADADGAAVLDAAPAAFDDEPEVEDVPRLVDEERAAEEADELPLDTLREHRAVPYAEPRERRRLLRRGRR